MDTGTTPSPGTGYGDEFLSRAFFEELEASPFKLNTSLSEACSFLLARKGKQLRGRLLVAAARQGPEPEAPQVGRAAQAIELLHLASLAHDDVIDSGTVRRGVPTVGVRFGQPAAGFAGAWLFARATELIAECGPTALDLFSQTALQMCEGGMLELRGLYNARRTTTDYFAVADQKTASAFWLAARLGAELAGASPQVSLSVGDFGREFGMAYQIWDDLVDLLADSARSGKTPASDLRQGVYTLPVIYALEESDELRALLAEAGVSNGDEAEAVSLVTRTAGVELATKDAEARAAAAEASLDGMTNPEALRSLMGDARRRHLEMLP